MNVEKKVHEQDGFKFHSSDTVVLRRFGIMGVNFDLIKADLQPVKSST